MHAASLPPPSKTANEMVTYHGKWNVFQTRKLASLFKPNCTNSSGVMDRSPSFQTFIPVEIILEVADRLSSRSDVLNLSLTVSQKKL